MLFFIKIHLKARKHCETFLSGHFMKHPSEHLLVLKKCLEHVLKTCLEDILKTLWRKAKYLLGISVPKKSKCVSNKSIFNKSTCDNSKANPKCIK